MEIKENHIIIGLGGTGGSILRSFRKRIFQGFNQEQRDKLPLGYVYVDSSLEMMDPNDPTWKVLGENSQLGRDNQLFIRGASLRSQLDNVDSYPGIKKWIGNRKIWDNIVGNIADDGAAAQRRRLGRFLFSCKSQEFLNILQNQTQYVRHKNNEADVTFHLIAGLAGGTGSGSIIDAISQIRKIYERRDQGSQFKIFVYVLVPEQTPKPGWDKGFYHANGYSALLELNALSTGLNPYDVTGQSDKIEFNGSVIFDGCYLFSNINENGVIVDTKTELPNIVADFLFQKLTLSNGSIAREQLRRAEANENLQDFFEYDENAKDTDNKKPVRSLRFLGFGIKRIEIPEEEIIEYFTYNFTRQSLLQFKYNNWSDDFGFRDQPKNEDYHSMVNDKQTIANWYLSDDHITLSKAILKSDENQKWKTIIEDWNAIIPLLKSTAWDNVNDKTTPLNQLSKLCEERYERNFRKIGVSEFYKLKKQAKKEIAKEISDIIEKDLFQQWKTGQRSVSEILKILNLLIDATSTRLLGIATKLNQIGEEIEKQIINKQKNEVEWSKVGFLSGDIFGKKKKIFEAHGVILQTLYNRKTEQEAWQFAKELLAEVLNQLQLFSGQLSHLSDRINSFISLSEKIIASHCLDNEINQETYKDAIIRYYNSKEVRKFTERIVKDSSIQKRQTSIVRDKIVNQIGSEPTFTKFNERISDEFLTSTLENIAQEQSVAAHEELITNKKEKIIGVNIIEKLYEQYGNDQSALNDFIRNVVKYSGVFINFDNGELIRNIPNNNAPILGTNIKIESIVVCLPFVEEKRDFIEKLKLAFKASMPGGKILHFDDQSDKKNEIAIISLANGFPVRVVNEVKILKQKYDVVLNQMDENIARLVLHLEGDGTQYPRIFLPSDKEKEEENNIRINKFLPYFLIAKGMDIVTYTTQEGTGRGVFGINKVDARGRQVGLLEIGSKMIDVLNSFNEELECEIIENVIEKLAGDFLHVDKRKEIEKGITDTINTIILKECNGMKKSSDYERFFAASDKAYIIIES